MLTSTIVEWSTWVYSLFEVELLAHPYHVAIEVAFLLVILYIFRMPIHKARDTKNDKPTPEETEELIRNFRSEPFAVPDIKIDYTAPVMKKYAGAYCYIEPAPASPSAATKENNSGDHDSGAGDGAANVTQAADDTDTNDAPVNSDDTTQLHQVAKFEGSDNDNSLGKKVLNVSSFDFLCYATEPSVIEAASDTIVEYGCGSCGPRGFYGSLKPHLDLEAGLAKFMGTHSAIIYSFSFATASTLIPCFSSRGDEILCDESVSLVLQQGCSLSRSHVQYYRHNDMEHLEDLMKASHKLQKKKGKRVPPRRFVITEGVFRNTGTLCNLREVATLKEQYKYRLVLDDSFAFGMMGKTGRGTPEHFKIPIDQIEIYVGALSTSLGSVGGFCCGSHMMIDHQRLAATGYVFSAALPPYASVGALHVLQLIAEDPSRIHKLQKYAGIFRKLFESGKVKLPDGVAVITPTGDLNSAKKVSESKMKSASPSSLTVSDGSRGEEGNTNTELMMAPTALVHIATTIDDTEQWIAETKKFVKVAEDLLELDAILVMPALYNTEERVPVRPTLRVSLKSEVEIDEIERLAVAIANRLTAVFE